MTGSRFLVAGPAAETLVRAFPPFVVVRPGPEQETVRWALQRIAAELREPRPGGALSIAHLDHFLLVQLLRCHLADAPPGTAGWLAAIADPHLSRVVAAMHKDPARHWTVAALASRAGLSRTPFAVRFRRVTDQTPIGYLTAWRMLYAADKLRRTDEPLARVAAEVGYASQSAFGLACKRTMGQTPRRYVRGARSSGREPAGADGHRRTA